MSNRTIQISGIPQTITKEQITQVFSDLRIKKIHIQKDNAFIQLQSGGNQQNFQLNFSQLIIPVLQTATIKYVDQQFDWQNIQDDKKQIQSLKSQKSYQLGVGQYAVLQPDYMRKVIINNCEYKILKHMTEENIKDQIFGQFKIKNVIKIDKNMKESILVLEFLESEEVEKLLKKKDGKFLKLGKQIKINKVDEEFNFQQIIQQCKKQFQLSQTIKHKQSSSSQYQKLLQISNDKVDLRHFFIVVFLFMLIYVIMI